MTKAPARAATPQDVDDICLGLPEVALGTSWGDNLTYKVRGKGFLMHRPPGRTAIDPATGEWFTDLLVIQVPGENEKRALVEDDSLPFFTIDHFNGYNAVLVQQSRLGEVSRDELAEIITDAWLTKAPKSLAKAFLAPGPGPMARSAPPVTHVGGVADAGKPSSLPARRRLATARPERRGAGQASPAPTPADG